MYRNPMEQLPTSRILIVEEEEIHSDRLFASLQKAGAEITGPVGSLEAALLVLRTERVCAVLFTANLDRGEGAKKLSASLEAQRIPALVIDWSPMGPPAEWVSGEHLAWPFSYATLIAAVERLVTGLPEEVAGLI